MWIVFQERFQTKDYNKLKRIFEKHWIWKLRYSHVVIIKVAIEKYCLWKSRRHISGKYWINYSTLYHIYNNSISTTIIRESLEYCLSRKILVYYTEDLKQALSDEQAIIKLQSLVIKKSL